MRFDVYYATRINMTVCPIAIAVGCQKCPAFKVCPAKSILGDQPKAAEKPQDKKN